MRISKDALAIHALTEAATSAALTALVKYQRRKDRKEHPAGQFDNAGRFYPCSYEDCGVSLRVRTPSRSYPHSYMLACRTLEHCEALTHAEHDDVLLLKRVVKKAGLEIPDAYEGTGDVLAYLTAMRRQVDAIQTAPTATRARART